VTTSLIDDVLDAPHDAAALAAILGEEQIEALLSATQQPYDEDTSPRLGDALGRAMWLLVEQARLQNRPVAPLYERVVVAHLAVLTERIERGDDVSAQSALNTAFRALASLPAQPFAFAAEAIFVLHGERTAERLSLEEAMFPFSEPLPAIVASLRDALTARAELEGWARD
jgi:hypothetical protein